MKGLFFGGVLVAAIVAGCTMAQQNQAVSAAKTVPGQLFCAIQLSGGGTLIASAINAEASALAPATAPVAIIATGATKTFVDKVCDQAAQNVAGATAGVAVSPPPDGTTTAPIAVVVSKIAS